MKTLVRDRENSATDARLSADSASEAGSIVLAYDGTLEARTALGAAIEQAWWFGGKLLVVFGVEPPGPRVGEGFKEHRRALEEQGSKLGAEAVKEARTAGVEAEAILVRRTRAEAVAAVASGRGARVVIVGTRGEGPLRGAVTGSLAHKLLRLSEVPVLCVKR